jgi:hypothetical protein
MSRKTLYRLLGTLSFAGYGWLAWNSVFSHSPTVCMFKAVTHVPCPSCGTTRAFMLLIRGDISGSLLLNPLGVILFIALAVIPVWLIADIFLNRESLHRRYKEMECLLKRRAWISMPLMGLVLVNWFWNIAKRL